MKKGSLLRLPFFINHEEVWVFDEKDHLIVE